MYIPCFLKTLIFQLAWHVRSGKHLFSPVKKTLNPKHKNAKTCREDEEMFPGSHLSDRAASQGANPRKRRLAAAVPAGAPLHPHRHRPNRPYVALRFGFRKLGLPYLRFFFGCCCCCCCCVIYSGLISFSVGCFGGNNREVRDFGNLWGLM